MNKTTLQHHLHPLNLFCRCRGKGKRFWKVYENTIWKVLRPSLKIRRNYGKKKEA